MKKVLAMIGGLTILFFVAFIYLYQTKEQPVITKISKITNNLELTELKPEEYSIKTLSNDLVEVGVDNHSQNPYLKLNKWDGEVSLKINIPYQVTGKPVNENNKLVYTTKTNNNEKIVKSC